MQTEAGGQLSAELKIGGEATPQVVAQHLLDRIAPERQLHQLRQHLETGQGLIDRTVGADQSKAVDHIPFRAVVAHGRQGSLLLRGRKQRQGGRRCILHRAGGGGETGVTPEGIHHLLRQSHQAGGETIGRRQIRVGLNETTWGGFSPGGGEENRGALILSGSDRFSGRSAVATGLVVGLKQLQRGNLGIGRACDQGFQKELQFLRPQLAIAPSAETRLCLVQMQPRLIRDRRSHHLLGSDDVLTGVTAEQTCRSQDASRPELAHRGHASPLLTDQAGLALQQHQHAGGNLTVLHQLMSEIKLEATRLLLKPGGTLRAEILERRQLKQGEGG